MTNIPLRAYTREIEGLVEHEQRLDEAIAHCRQILKTYPKHLATYRLLGKAYLEGKRYDQAVDIFERLLVAVPDDFVAHVGMSIIADDQGKLDDAIWHMERAFEVQPSNAAIQGELQRLFGRRDGVEPPKIRLTRGALAHMYVQGQLYPQAISEIRAVLAQDAERADLQVLLAKAYFHSGQKNEAADVCTQLLSRYQYCFDANGLMVDLLAGTPSAESAPEYRQRLNELEPYAAFTHDSVFGTASVPDNAVTVERLEYVAEAPHAGPLMASGLGASAVAQSSAWNAIVSREQPEKDLPPFLRAASSTAARTASPQPLEAAGPRAAVLPETPSGDLPAWVKALAPTDDDDAMEDSDPNAPEALTWLRSDDMSAGAAASELDGDISEAETPAWLKDLGTETEQPVEQAAPSEPELATGQDLPVPTVDTTSLGTGSSLDEDDGLAWLERLAAKRGETPDETMTPAESRPSGPTSWADKAAEIGQQAADAWTAIAEDSREQPEAAAETSANALGSDGVAMPDGGGSQPPETVAEEPPLDWLSGLAGPEIAGSKPAESAAEEPPAEVAPAEAAPAEWLSGLAAPESAGSEPPESGAEAPPAEWLSGLAEPESAVIQPPESSAVEPPADWLHSLAQQGAFADESDAGPEEATPSPIGGALSEWPKMTPPPTVGEEPAWLGAVSSEAGLGTPRVSPTPAADSASEADLPDWLSGTEKEKSVPSRTTPSEGPPAWLKPEDKQVLQAPEVATPSDWRPADSAPSSGAVLETPDSGRFADQPVAPAVSAVGTPTAPESGLIPKPAKQGMSLLGTAQSEMGRGNIAAALDMYTRLIHKGKSLADIIRDLRDALSRYPVEVPLWQALGDAYMRSNRLQEALDAYTKAEELLR